MPASNRLRSRSGEMWRVEGHRGDIPDGSFLRQFVGVHRACKRSPPTCLLSPEAALGVHAAFASIVVRGGAVR